MSGAVSGTDSGVLAGDSAGSESLHERILRATHCEPCIDQARLGARHLEIAFCPGLINTDHI